MDTKELVQKIQNLGQLDFLERSFFNAGFYHPSDSQKAQLLAQGNQIKNWATFYLSSSTLVSNIHQCWFGGLIRLNLGSEGLLWQSIFEDVEINEGCRIWSCSLVRRSVVDKDVQLRGVNLDCTKPTSYGLGTAIGAGIETGGRVLYLDPHQDFSNLSPVYSPNSSEPRTFTGDFNYLGPGTSIQGPGRLDGILTGSGLQMEHPLEVRESCFLSTTEDPIYLGPGVIVRQSLLHEGVRIDSGAQVVQSQLMDFSCAERGVLVTQSLLGPDSHVAEGEVTACVLGPFVGFHHQSLLIAAWWPSGRGNVGSGAQIGSNHTSRLPDQEIRPGEGMFFGLSTAVKFPSNFENAPYTVIATGVTTLPQSLGTPFSLVLEGDSGAAGLNRLIPGWVLAENIYMILRNELKYTSRSKSSRFSLDYRVFRPEIVDKLWRTFEILGDLPVKSVYNFKDCPLFGQNYVLDKDLGRAKEVYRQYYEYGVLRIWAQRMFQHKESGLFSSGGVQEEEWLEKAFANLGWNPVSPDNRSKLLNQWWRAEQQVWKDAQKSLEKDHSRGSKIMGDYADSHLQPSEDPFIVHYQKYLELWSNWLT